MMTLAGRDRPLWCRWLQVDHTRRGTTHITGAHTHDHPTRHGLSLKSSQLFRASKMDPVLEVYNWCAQMEISLLQQAPILVGTFCRFHVFFLQLSTCHITAGTLRKCNNNKLLPLLQRQLLEIIDWEFVTSVFKMRKNSRILLFFCIKIRKSSFYRITSSCKVFEFAQHTSSRLHRGNRWMGTVSIDDRGLRFWHRGRQWSCRRFVVIISCLWSCWTVDELTNLLLSAVCEKNLLELCGDECDNLNFMNFKIDSFKIRKNSWIFRKIREFLELLKFIKLFSICAENIAPARDPSPGKMS